MKKRSFAILISASSCLASTVYLPSWAIDCPDIPSTVQEVTVKDDQSMLKPQPTKKENDSNRPKIKQGDKLKIRDTKATLSESHCWYKVNPAANSDSKEWWIAGDVGIVEFSQWKEVKNQQSPALTPAEKSESNTQNRNEKSNPLWFWVATIAGFISISGIISSIVFLFLRLHKSSEKQRELSGNIKDIEMVLTKVKNQVDQNQKYITKLNERSQKSKEVFKEIDQEIKSLDDKYSSLLQSQNTVTATTNFNNREYEEINAVAESIFPNEPPNPIKAIVDQFNSQNQDYFRDPRFQPLTLSQQSIQGHIGLNARRIMQLEAPSDPSQGSYLYFEIDQEFWLIPNIASPYITQIMHNLNENPEIFVVHLGSGRLKLVKPAKLKQINAGLWEVEEPGKFESL
ncbi:hypothetical protein [Synechocystis sp. LKSZ1]|uniref:hypothetical protein n=1 Tax=Synechocystis sp. LKSZ1 TaxID=3144951 RepID=UPI00336BD20D